MAMIYVHYSRGLTLWQILNSHLSPGFLFSLEIICGGACCKFVGFFIPHTRGQQNQSDRACHEPILISKDRHRDILYLDLFKT